ncbi:MAG TPA: hypothetical protein VGU46_12390 [Acidobacteriaceae bacterium]|nr:hypothetical protein [Acidobacteriaceae bacterium]
MTVLKPRVVDGNGEKRRRRVLLTPLNLHWAGVGLLALMNLVILVQMGLLWHAASGRSADAMAAEQVQLKMAQIAAQPLRGLDGKLGAATDGADRFYRDRLPVSNSEIVGELGRLAKKDGVRLGRVSYAYDEVLPGTTGELSEVRMDATLSGDYGPLVRLINSLERDKVFFVIKAVTLTGQQTGMVSLRLKLTTYLRPDGTAVPAAMSAGTVVPAAANGGRGR